MLVKMTKTHTSQNIPLSKNNAFVEREISFMGNYNMTSKIVGSQKVGEFTKMGKVGIRLVDVTNVTPDEMAYYLPN